MSISCSTCLECFNPRSEVSSTPCGHLFHTICIKKWFQNNQKNCPQCRNPFELNETHKIYFSEASEDNEENDGAQKLLEQVFDMVSTNVNHHSIVQVVKENICKKCKRPVNKSDRYLTLGNAYHYECQPYFMIKNQLTKMVLTVDSTNIGPYDEYPCHIQPILQNSQNDKQLWFWDHDIDGDFHIKSKAFPDRALDLNRTDFNHRGMFWKGGTVSLLPYPSSRKQSKVENY